MSKKTKVLVALSGGVDSSIAAYLLKKAGYEIFGLHLILWKYKKGVSEENRINSILKKISEIIGFEYQIINVSDEFWNRIVKYFIKELSRGVTPNPCVICNPTLKLATLFQQAEECRISLISTGHYARIYQSKDIYEIRKAKDGNKDQSYVLNQLRQEQLQCMILPLGELEKVRTMEIARQIGLPVDEMKESQDLCFLSGQNYRNFLKEYASEILQPGEIVDIQGRIIGEHKGLALYTIGQRKGIGIFNKNPLYVIKKDIKLNRLIVDSKEYLGRNQLIAGPINWTSGESPALPNELQVKIRATAAIKDGMVTPLNKDFVNVQFKHPLRDITPGQFAVFYRDDLMLGGGMIKD